MLIAVDLDGTALRSLRELDEASAAALRRARERGHRVMIATARPSCLTRPFYDGLGLDGPVALLNGADFLRYGDAAFPHQRHYMTAGSVRAFLDGLPSGSVEAVWLENDDELFATDIFRGSAYFDEVYDHSHVRRARLDALPAVEVGRMFVWAREGAVPARELDAALHVPGLAVTYRRWRDGRGLLLFDVRSVLADKWYCVEQAAAYYGLGPQEIVAFGDEMNDAMMLTRAGQGFVLRGGSEELRALVGRSTEKRCDEGGVGETLERMLG